MAVNSSLSSSFQHGPPKRSPQWRVLCWSQPTNSCDLHQPVGLLSGWSTHAAHARNSSAPSAIYSTCNMLRPLLFKFFSSLEFVGYSESFADLLIFDCPLTSTSVSIMMAFNYHETNYIFVFHIRLSITNNPCF